MFASIGQTFALHDLVVILILTLLEGLLSIDNAVVLGLLAGRLPAEQRSKALTYGLVGSFVFRLIAVAAATWLLRIQVVKLIGGGYLVYIAVKHLLAHAKPSTPTPTGGGRQFWSTVISIELTDAAFAIDSILAGIALVGPAPDRNHVHPKLWVVLIGGMLGVVVMRFAATGFIWLLKRFPRFETAAYLLVSLVGAKLILDYFFGEHGLLHDRLLLEFESRHRPEFWIFWALMTAFVAMGFLPSTGGGPDDREAILERSVPVPPE